MPSNRLLSLVFFLTAILAPTARTEAQHSTRQENSVSLVQSSVVRIHDGVNRTSEDTNFGSLAGRVVLETKTTPAAGIKNVKVFARRLNAGFGNFFFERVTDVAGLYEFTSLRPGRYLIEIDRSTLPADLPIPERKVAMVDVEFEKRSHFDITLPLLRSITGIVYTDTNDNGRYDPVKDAVVKGACITANGKLAISDEKGRYTIADLSVGRISLLVTRPSKSESSHVVLDLGTGTQVIRTVNVSLLR
ncbi:MAG TPA: carboxypeptidase-like regulatory domain-containing protein [Pyrinomonadaceae bacterium]|jgi:hypothetical protein|nr:carboxypeptidase-like regulatory domain-containing protein [Pyrinomonadaceae bacterium]